MVHDLKMGDRDIVLSSPLSLEGVIDHVYTPSNILQLILSIFSNVRPGADLSRFQLPPMFNMPKSQIQCYGELVYAINKDMLSICAKGETAIDRMISVVAWYMSTVRTPIFGIAPYNSTLGETHHVSRGTFNVLVEQVSHHPPITALHATDNTNNIELIWCQHLVAKFYGAYVEGETRGERRLNLLEKGETYVMNSPRILIRFLPKMSTYWVGTVKIKCQETGLEAEICHKSDPIWGFGGVNGSVKGKIIDSTSLQTKSEIYGQWNRVVYIKDTINGKIEVLYNPEGVISQLPVPIVRDPQGVWESEGALVWAEVSKAILSKDWDKARDTKSAIEEKQREIQKERKSRAEEWAPKYFELFHNPTTGYWECSPKLKNVPPAPIIFPC